MDPEGALRKLSPFHQLSVRCHSGSSRRPGSAAAVTSPAAFAPGPIVSVSGTTTTMCRSRHLSGARRSARARPGWPPAAASSACRSGASRSAGRSRAASGTGRWRAARRSCCRAAARRPRPAPGARSRPASTTRAAGTRRRDGSSRARRCCRTSARYAAGSARAWPCRRRASR